MLLEDLRESTGGCLLFERFDRSWTKVRQRHELRSAHPGCQSSRRGNVEYRALQCVLGKEARCRLEGMLLWWSDRCGKNERHSGKERGPLADQRSE
jgi:hypothetical protein